MRLPILSLFIVVPLAEILILIEIGKRIGLLPTVALVLTTALIGVTLLKRQGLSVLAEAQSALDRGEMPVQSVADGACLLVAGAFLLTPGLITDTAGFLLLIPRFRRWLAARIMKKLIDSGKVDIRTHGPFGRQPEPPGGGASGDGKIIETEYHEVDTSSPPPDAPDSRPSPWNRDK